MLRATTVVALATLGLSLAGPALAQSPTVRSATIAAGKDVRLHTVTSLKGDCSIGSAGTLRVTTPPKNGAIVIKTDKKKTPTSFRCPSVDTATQELIYRSKPNFAGTDEVAFEATNADGAKQQFTIKLKIEAGKGKSGAIQDI